MKVHICDLCENIIKYPTSRKIIKIKKSDDSIDFVPDRFDFDRYFYSHKYTLCPQCFEHMLEFIENMRKVDKEILTKSTEEDKSNA